MSIYMQYRMYMVVKKTVEADLYRCRDRCSAAERCKTRGEIESVHKIGYSMVYIELQQNIYEMHSNI